MRMPHTPYHWIQVATVVALALLTLSEAHGQPTGGAGAVFEGRPAMAGAQGGLGAQAGPPQGGIGVQGDAAAPALRKDIGKPKGTKEIGQPRDTGLARDQGSAAKKAGSAAKNTLRRSRTGSGEIETRSGTGG